ncbi:MAG: hypothetical protein OXN97_01765 [Bryobacterales bacterium]|nr:hypothetical protein [Bryobacterales bacterium]MDE0628177.1 hypothetical protein [Bryobacterales bacterium]
MRGCRQFGVGSCLCFGTLLVLIMAAPVSESLDREADFAVIARNGGHIGESISARYDLHTLHNHRQAAGPPRLPYVAPT